MAKKQTQKTDVKSLLAGAKLERVTGGESFKFEKPGQKLEGVYRGNRKGEFDGKEIVIHRIEDVNNKVWEVWESKALEPLSSLPKDAIVTIEFLEKKKGKRGRTFKVFDIFSSEPLNT